MTAALTASRLGVDVSVAFIADVRRRWAAAHGYLAGSARLNVHDRVGSVACGPLDSGVSIHVMADDFVGVVDALVHRMLVDIGERESYESALELSIAAIEETRARREREVEMAVSVGDEA